MNIKAVLYLLQARRYLLVVSLFVIGLLAAYVKIPYSANTNCLLTASGHSYQIVGVNPLIFKDGNKGLYIHYVTRKALTDISGLRDEATELAREYLRTSPNFLAQYPKGVLVKALDRAPPASGFHTTLSYTTPIEPTQIQKILSELLVSSKKFHVIRSGWARTLHGPIEETITEGQIGLKYYYIIILDGVKRDNKGIARLKITADAKSPDGKILKIDLQVEVTKEVGLVAPNLFLRFDPGDKPGEYKIGSIKILDMMSGKIVELKSVSMVLK